MTYHSCIKKKNAGSQRRGIVLATVILCFLVASAMIFNLVRATTVLSRQTTHQSERIQLQILTQDAMSHALIQYRNNNSYTGETWEILPEQWALKQTGQVQIRIKKQDEEKLVMTIQGMLKQDDQVLQKLTKTLELK